MRATIGLLVACAMAFAGAFPHHTAVDLRSHRRAALRLRGGAPTMEAIGIVVDAEIEPAVVSPNYLVLFIMPRTAAGKSAGSTTTLALAELDIVFIASMYCSPNRYMAGNSLS